MVELGFGEKGVNIKPMTVVKRDSWRGQSIMVRGEIVLNQKLGLVVFQNISHGWDNGITTAHYINQMLRPYVSLHFACHRNHVFQHNNACMVDNRLPRTVQHSHTATVCLSINLNPRAHLWDEIQRGLNAIHPRPTTVTQLMSSFNRMWAVIPMAFINWLIHSVYRRRCLVGINGNNGDHMRYWVHLFESKTIITWCYVTSIMFQEMMFYH